MTEIGALAAFAAGVLALLSPCSALLLPSFFAYAFADPRALLVRTGVFTLGLMLTLVPLGTGVSLVAEVFYGHRQTLVLVAGWLIIAFGVLQILGRSFAMPFSGLLQGTLGRWAKERQQHGSYLGTLVLGGVYGLAGFCSGPALGAILTMAATSPSPLSGALLLAMYALGMAAPLFVLALLWDRFQLGQRSWLRGRILHLGPLSVHSTSLVSGLLFVAIGVTFLAFDGTAGLLTVTGVDTQTEFIAQQWVVDTFGSVPGWVILLAVSAVALSIYAVRRRSNSNRTDQDEQRRAGVGQK